MNCSRCNHPILKGQPYARTKKGPHHFMSEHCSSNDNETRLKMADRKLRELGYCWRNGEYKFQEP